MAPFLEEELKQVLQVVGAGRALGERAALLDRRILHIGLDADMLEQQGTILVRRGLPGIALGFFAERFVTGWREWMPIGSSEPGPRSRERRRSLGLSLAEVAAAAEVSAATLSRFEREEGRTPSLLHVETSEDGGEWPYLVNERLASALGFASIAEHECCAGD